MREAPTYKRRHLLGVELAAIPFVVRPHALALALAERRPMLSGTFLQLLTEHHSWREEQWVHLFDAFRRLSLSQVILQWVMSDGQSFFASNVAGSVRSPLQMILELGETTNIDVIVGLVHDSDYWLRIDQPSPAVATYLANRESRIVQLVTEITPLFRRHGCERAPSVVCGRAVSADRRRAARFGRVPCERCTVFPSGRPAASRGHVRVGAHRVQRP